MSMAAFHLFDGTIILSLSPTNLFDSSVSGTILGVCGGVNERDTFTADSCHCLFLSCDTLFLTSRISLSYSPAPVTVIVFT